MTDYAMIAPVITDDMMQAAMQAADEMANTLYKQPDAKNEPWDWIAEASLRAAIKAALKLAPVRRDDKADQLYSELDRWQDAARSAGVCMSCAGGSLEPCTDCFGTGWDEGEPLQARNLREALVDATANLVAVASAYRRHASRFRGLRPRAVADPFYTTRANDFDKAAERARQAAQFP